MTFQPGHTLSPGRRFGSRNKRTAEIFNRLETRGDIDDYPHACTPEIFGAQFASRILDLNNHIPMTFEPGKSGNPNGYKGPRDRARREVFEIIKNLGHKDALETLSYLQHNEQIEPGLRIAAAAALAPFCHPKMQATPTPRFIDTPIDVPHFDRLSDAESFLGKLPVLVARGELDFQSAQELSAMTTLWINTQYQREELAIKQINAGTTEHEQTIRIEGGLPALPGTSIVMPVLDGHATNGNGHAALAAPEPAVPAIEPSPKSQDDPGPPPQDPEL